MKVDRLKWGSVGCALVLTVVVGIWPALVLGQVGESVGEGVVRYHPSAEARDGALPSLCLMAPLGPIMQWSDERPLDELELLVNPGTSARSRPLRL
jgi:hypothetical protein